MHTCVVCGKPAPSKQCEHCGWTKKTPLTTKYMTKEQVSILRARYEAISYRDWGKIPKHVRYRLREEKRLTDAVTAYHGTPSKRDESKRDYTRKARSALASAIRTAKRGLEGYCDTTRCTYSELRTFLSQLAPGKEIDHIYPLSRASSLEDAMWLNRLDNLRVISRTLNRQKGSKLI